MQAKIGEPQSLYDIGCLVEAQINSDTVNDRIKFVIWLYDKTADTNEIVLQIICSKEILSWTPIEDILIRYFFGKM